MYDKTVTICNKYKRKDNGAGQDIYVPTVIKNAEFSGKTVSSVNGNTVSMGMSYIVLIPKSNNSYSRYVDWKNDHSLGYTVSVEDTIFFSEITEEITPDNITELKENYEHCTVRSVIVVDDDNPGFVKVKIEGV